MIDIHSHILNEVDDGSDSLDMSLDILRKAEEAGFTDIILTPHYIEDYYDNTRGVIRPRINLLKRETFKESIIVDLHHGNEIFLSENTPDLLNRNKIATLANSRYVLFEIPFSNKMLNLAQIIEEIKQGGYIPILAHPERYSYIQENPRCITDIIKQGVFLQCNYGSFIGQYGKSAKRTAEIFLENHLVHFLGTDTHKHGLVYENFVNIKKKITDIAKDEQYINQITTINPRNVINDIDIDINEYPKEIEEKKKKFLFLKK